MFLSQSEAIPESVKNMLLVMSTQGVLEVSMPPNKVSELLLACLAYMVQVQCTCTKVSVVTLHRTTHQSC